MNLEESELRTGGQLASNERRAGLVGSDSQGQQSQHINPRSSVFSGGAKGGINQPSSWREQGVSQSANFKRTQEPKRLKYFNSRLPYPASRPARALPTPGFPRRDQGQVTAALHQTLGSMHSSSQ